MEYIRTSHTSLRATNESYLIILLRILITPTTAVLDMV